VLRANELEVALDLALSFFDLQKCGVLAVVLDLANSLVLPFGILFFLTLVRCFLKDTVWVRHLLADGPANHVWTLLEDVGTML